MDVLLVNITLVQGKWSLFGGGTTAGGEVEEHVGGGNSHSPTPAFQKGLPTKILGRK